MCHTLVASPAESGSLPSHKPVEVTAEKCLLRFDALNMPGCGDMIPLEQGPALPSAREYIVLRITRTTFKYGRRLRTMITVVTLELTLTLVLADDAIKAMYPTRSA